MSAVRAAALADVANNQPYAATVSGVDIVLVRQADQIYALADECTHGAIPLSEGAVEGCTLECWLHGSKFDLRTGEPVNLPATEPVATYPVRIEGDDILVDVDHQENA